MKPLRHLCNHLDPHQDHRQLPDPPHLSPWLCMDLQQEQDVKEEDLITEEIIGKKSTDETELYVLFH